MNTKDNESHLLRPWRWNLVIEKKPAENSIRTGRLVHKQFPNFECSYRVGHQIKTVGLNYYDPVSNIQFSDFVFPEGQNNEDSIVMEIESSLPDAFHFVHYILFPFDFVDMKNGK